MGHIDTRLATSVAEEERWEKNGVGAERKGRGLRKRIEPGLSSQGRNQIVNSGEGRTVTSTHVPWVTSESKLGVILTAV